MLEQYIPIIHNVISLARNREKVPSLMGGNCSVKSVIDVFSAKENPEFERLDKELFNYLDSLDYETLKVIQTIMYLGKNNDYNRDLLGEDIYIDYRQYMDEIIGWNTKEEAVLKIDEKSQLADYLENGLSIIY